MIGCNIKLLSGARNIRTWDVFEGVLKHVLKSIVVHTKHKFNTHMYTRLRGANVRFPKTNLTFSFKESQWARRRFVSDYV